MRLNLRANRVVSWCVLFLCVAVLAGCGGKKTGGDVSGKVTYNGKAVTSGSVAFHGSDGKSVSSSIASDGSYKIVKPPLGEVKITVETSPPLKVGSSASPKSPDGKEGPPKADIPLSGKTGGEYVAIPDKYKKPATSGLSFTVTILSQTHDIELK
jgi:hypothetical protein